MKFHERLLLPGQKGYNRGNPPKEGRKMQYHYETRGVCSRAIDINLDEATGIIRNVSSPAAATAIPRAFPLWSWASRPKRSSGVCRASAAACAPPAAPISWRKPDRKLWSRSRLRRRIEEREESA